MVDLIGVSPVSHDGKALLHVLETYPRDELFQSSRGGPRADLRGVVNLYERRRVRVFLRRDPYRRFFSCLIYVPRDRYNTQARERIEPILRDELHGRRSRVAGADLRIRPSRACTRWCAPTPSAP